MLESTRDQVVFTAGDREATLSLMSLTRLAVNASPEQVRVWIEERVGETFRALSSDPAEVLLSDLLPRLRPSAERGPAWSTTWVADQLDLCLVADRPGSLRYLSPLDVAALPIGLQAVIALAHDNLRACAPQGRWVPAGEGLRGLRSDVGDGHDGSRILVAETWFADPRGLFVMVPSRDLGFVIPVSSAQSFVDALDLYEVAQDLFHAAAYPIAQGIFWLRESRLVPLSVVPSDGRLAFANLPEELAQSG